jgi:hypothetical protein
VHKRSKKSKQKREEFLLNVKAFLKKMGVLSRQRCLCMYVYVHVYACFYSIKTINREKQNASFIALCVKKIQNTYGYQSRNALSTALDLYVQVYELTGGGGVGVEEVYEK